MNEEQSLKKLEQLILGVHQQSLPQVSKNLYDWIRNDRPTVGAKDRNFNLASFYISIYEDNHPNIMCVQGRQTWKTTTSTDIIGWLSTAYPFSEVGYVVDNEARRLSFSTQRLRNETFLQTKLRNYLPHERANVGHIALLNNSNIYLANDEGGYKNIEGKSLRGLIFDEWQYHDQIESMQKAMYTLFVTHGRFWGFGIGGEAGSEYHKKWMQTDQREWIYEYNGDYQGWPGQEWRSYLKFDNQGNIINENLAEVLKGRWISTRPENTEFRGYHLPQTIFALIPLTIRDATELYKISPTFSIEWQMQKVNASIFKAHVLGEFYKAERRPITPEMVYACMTPYRHLSLLSAEQVNQLKIEKGNKIRILMGIDWGSGPSASSTVVTIMIKNKVTETYQIAWIEKRPQEHQLDQAGYMARLAEQYQVNSIVADLGYGAIQVKVMQEGGYDSQGRQIPSLGKRRMQGCRTIGDETKPVMDFKTETDEHGTEQQHVNIDKTTIIQKWIDFIGWYVDHEEIIDGNTKRPKLIIPYKNNWETDFLVDDFCSLTRKDLEKELDIITEDPRQKAKKEFNHPKDSLMSCIYCMVADEKDNEDAFRILGIKKRT